MPNMDGFGVLKIMNQKKWIENVSVVINGSIYSEEFLRLLKYINE